MCEHYIAHGLCTDFSDWSIAAVGLESLVKIGYEYGRSMTGKELTVDLNLYEDKEHNQTTPTFRRRQLCQCQLRFMKFLLIYRRRGNFRGDLIFVVTRNHEN